MLWHHHNAWFLLNCRIPLVRSSSESTVHCRRWGEPPVPWTSVVHSSQLPASRWTAWLSERALSTLSSEPFLFPKLRNYFADFPYLHYSSWPEAANLGDLMRLWVRPGVKLSHLDFQGPSRAHLIPQKARYSSRYAPLSLAKPISGALIC